MASKRAILAKVDLDFDLKKRLTSIEKKSVGYIKRDLESLNYCIDEYHNNPSKETFDVIDKQLNLLVDHYPATLLGKFPRLLYALYHDAMDALVHLRRRWYKPSSYLQDCYISLPQDRLTDLLTFMPSSKFSAVLDVLYNKKYSTKTLPSTIKHALEAIYPITDPARGQESLQFHHFLQTHEFKIISEHNARIIRVTQLINGNACVIRCPRLYRQGTFRIEKHARRTLGAAFPYFSPIYMERAGLTAGGRLHRLEVVPFFRNKSFFHYLMEMHDQRLETKKMLRILCAGHLQLIDFFRKYHEANFFFPDGKLENFLMHPDVNEDEYTLWVTDLKSTRYLDGQGGYQLNKHYADWDCELIYTLSVTPPEVVNSVPCSAEKASIFMLGSNLYTGSTCKRIKYSPVRYIVKQLTEKNFSQLRLFKSDAGQQLKSLILDCIQLDPKDRITFDEAEMRLNRIYPYRLEMQCRVILEQLKKFDYFSVDVRTLSNHLKELADSINHQQMNQFYLQINQQLHTQIEHTKHFIRYDDYDHLANNASEDVKRFLIDESLQRLNTIKKQYRQWDVLKIIPDENVLIYIADKKERLRGDLSLKDMVDVFYDIDSMLKNATAYIRKVNETCQQLTVKQQRVFLTGIRLLPLHYRLVHRTKDNSKQWYQRMYYFLHCHELMRQLNAYRYENLDSLPIIVDVPIRKYTHQYIEILYEESVSIYVLKQIKRKMVHDLTRLKQNLGCT